ncbi:F0F1 ATP synthase subunit epsilon [bacterium]|nr:F0F1 ATP synthase subunit epsilon [bacterium]
MEIVTPQRVLIEAEADYVTIPGELGELGILPGHIPLLTILQSGVLTYKSGSNEKKLAIHKGYAEICNDKITILAKTAELAEEIDLERAKSTKLKAEQDLEQAIKEIDQLELVSELQQKIRRSIVRQDAAQ